MSPAVIALVRPRQVECLDEPAWPLAADQVRIRTLLSGVSAGTEMAFYRGTNPYLDKRWDPETRVFLASSAHTLEYPITSWGYEEVGEVVEVGTNVADVPIGTRVFGTWGHRAEHVATSDFVRQRSLPPTADPLIGIFSHIGPIALNGVLDTQVRVGETVAVFGLGVVGQLASQILARAGAHVIGVDLLEARREIAAQLGTPVVLDPGAVDAAAEIKRLTHGRGADVCVEASGSTRALHSAIRACAYASRVVVLGFYQGEAHGLYLGEEFHHNRISLVCSQIGGLSADLQHRWDRARLVQTFMQMAFEGSVRCTDLVTHRVPVSEAASLYALIDTEPEAVLQAVIDFETGGAGQS